MTYRFENKVAIITGPSENGIGGAIAERLAEEGCALALWGVEVPKRLLKRFKRRDVPHIWTHCDITDSDAVVQAVDHCMSEFGKIDIVVNNAGVEFSGPLERVDDDAWEKLLAVNLTGAMKVSRGCLPYLAEPGGVIINIASALGHAGCFGYQAYSASKAGLIGMTKSLAMELAPRGIRSVCIAPAMVATPMVLKYQNVMDTETKNKIDAAHPLGIGSPHDIAAAAAFLASDEARWISGVSLPMGWLSQYPLPNVSERKPDSPSAIAGVKPTIPETAATNAESVAPSSAAGD